MIQKTLRSTFQNKGLTWINITGLGIGLAIAMFLLLYLSFEFSYDRHFKDASRIYRMLSEWKEEGKSEMYPINLKKLREGLNKEIPEVEHVCQVYREGIKMVYTDPENKMSVSAFMVDSTFFDIFNLPFVYGQQAHALNHMNQCILTKTTADKLFGTDVNPVGQNIQIEDWNMSLVISAVVEDVPLNTHFKFGILLPMLEEMNGYEGLEFFTYLKLKQGVNHEEALAKCNALNKKLLEDNFDTDHWTFDSHAESLTSLHVSTKADFDLTPKTNLSNLFFIILVVVFILGIALSNFISLYMIQGEKRAKEISVRKTNGASRAGIARMLFRETFLVTLIAFVLALILFFSGSGLLSALLNISVPPLSTMGGNIWWGFGLLYFVVAFLGASYPAFYLSRFDPADLIRKSVFRKFRLTATSVVVQFSIVIFCVSALFIVWKQLSYVKQKPLGFDKENIVLASARIEQAQYEGVKSELMNYPEIVSVGISVGTVLGDGSGQTIRRQEQSEKESILITEWRVGPGFLKTYGITILEGRDFGENYHAEKYNVLLSENMVKALGLTEPIGKKVAAMDSIYTVIGVIQDIYDPSMHSGARGLVLTSRTPQFYHLAVKFQPGEDRKAEKALRAVMNKRYAGSPVSFWRLDDIVKNSYKQDEITAKILISGTVLAIFLALLGLLALSNFVAFQKRKEIGIRRVAGAQAGDVVGGLVAYMIRRVLPAAPVGIVVCYFVMRHWLQGFTFSIPLSWWIFALALIVTLGVVVLAVIWPSWRAATENPVHSLKGE